ncbi:MAG: HNH endonuclease [Candidatus Nitrosocosmicus sp.]|nr:HNH endonuclease [Candidatus Nitrosocosmicus sp.]
MNRIIFILVLSAISNTILASDPTFAQDHLVYPYDTHCSRNDSTGSVDQYMKHLGTELKDYLSGSFTRTVDEEKEDDCPNQSIDTNTNLDVFANAFFGNAKLNDSIVVSFSKIFDLLVRSSSIVLLFSIVITGIFLNSLKKLKESTRLVRKGFSQGTRESILRKQNHKCVFCRKVLAVVDFHHKNGNRSDNRENNCQALCPNCHALKTRNRLVKN